MKLLKKGLIILLFFVFYIICKCNNSYAFTNNHSADEAINYVQSLVGTQIKDGNCVHLITDYAGYLGCNLPHVYHAKEWVYNNPLPDNWQRIEGAVPEKGDILIYNSNYESSAGHVAIFESENVTYHSNFNSSLVRRIEMNYKNAKFDTDYYWGVIRPDFKPPLPTKPIVTSCYVEMDSITSSQYKIRLYVSSEGGVNRVLFPTWDASVGTSSLGDWKATNSRFTGIKQSDGSYVFTVKKSDYNNAEGMYITHVYIYDNYGQETSIALNPIPMGSVVQNLEDFTARIVLKSDNSKVLGISSPVDTAAVVVKNKNLNDKTQLWSFKRKTNGAYIITNISTGFVLGVDKGEDFGLSDGEGIGIFTATNGFYQDFYPMSYNNGYRLVSGSSRDLKAVSTKNNQAIVDVNLVQYQAYSTNNEFQTWQFEKIATDISVSPTSVTLTEGKTYQLKTTITPSNTINNEKIKWSSSNRKIATVDSNGKITAVTGGTATITAEISNGKKATCKVTVENIPFVDVKTSDWFYNDVKYVYENKLITGYSDKIHFGPNDKITRAMVVTILYRMNGSPSVTGSSKFKDVKQNVWYSNAIKWATDKGIVHGYNSEKFGPNDNITRQDLMVILRNYAKYKKKDTNITMDLSKYSDTNKIAPYAKSAVEWAVKKGILVGGKGKLNPQGTATRAEMAAFIHRYCTKIGR